LLDGKDAYKQIQIESSHIDHSLFTTPDGTMVSLVMQIGDCNASTMYQPLMNHIFSDYIGVFMDMYPDDIVTYSDTLEEHVRHVKLVVDQLWDNKFFLSSYKLQFFKDKLHILEHVIDADGIRMDPEKVDKIISWKTPTNKSLVSSFIGAIGYLAPGCMGIRVPLQVLSNVAAPTHFMEVDTDRGMCLSTSERHCPQVVQLMT
jgi:Reverse transcriptase (RNA-dependent DNA polymerase)